MRFSTEDDAVNKVVEDTLFMIGEARDFLDRLEPVFHDMLSEVASGKCDLGVAQLTVRLEFHNALKDLEAWRKRFAPAAEAAGFPYLHKDLRPMPSFRLVMPLPEGGTA
jgi:hypothetical protein